MHVASAERSRHRFVPSETRPVARSPARPELRTGTPATRKARLRALGACMASALAFAGAGCTLGPDYVRPPVDTPDAYRFAGSAVPDDALAALPDWWKAFDDPELDALIDEGLAANHDLRIATARVDEFTNASATPLSETVR